MAEKLKPCPFCGGEAQLILCDDEGNSKDDGYINDPYSGVGYMLAHCIENNELCPVARYEDDSIGCFIYSSEKLAIEAWNKRSK